MVSRAQDIALLVGRLVLAVVFFVHGVQKWQDGVGTTSDMMAGSEVPMPTLAAVFTMGVEVFGSILFAIGLATPLVAAGFAVVSLGAVFFVHLDAGFLVAEGGYEFVLVLAAASLAIGLNPGRLSVDAVLRDKVASSATQRTQPQRG